MTSRFILDVLNLNLSSPRLFVPLGLDETVVVVFFFSATLNSIVISDERVVTNRSRAREWNSMICWGGISYMVEGSLALPHSGRSGGKMRGGRQIGLLDIEHGHLDIGLRKKERIVMVIRKKGLTELSVEDGLKRTSTLVTESGPEKELGEGRKGKADQQSFSKNCVLHKQSLIWSSNTIRELPSLTCQ
jgi:hypothetical protein